MGSLQVGTETESPELHPAPACLLGEEPSWGPVLAGLHPRQDTAHTTGTCCFPVFLPPRWFIRTQLPGNQSSKLGFGA